MAAAEARKEEFESREKPKGPEYDNGPGTGLIIVTVLVWILATFLLTNFCYKY